MSADLFGPTPEQEARARRQRDRRRLAAAFADAVADGDTAHAQAVLDLAAATAPTTDPTPAPTDPAPTDPAPLRPPTPAAVARAHRAAVKAAAADAERAARADAGRKAKATIALVIDTLTHLRAADGAHAWPEQPFAAPARNVNPYGAAGNFLRPQFTNDPALTPDEAAVAILKLIRRARRPVRIMVQPFDREIGAGRSGPYRTAADEGIDLLDRATGRGFVTVPLGLTRWNPDGPDDDEPLTIDDLTDTDDDLEDE